ncbi:MAG: ferredoxin family protein [Pirellulales bacterium]
MPKHLPVVISQGQSANPQKRGLEEELVAQLLMEPGIEVTLVPHLYDLKPDGTGMLCLQNMPGNFVVISWLYERAAFWTLDRNKVRGRFGQTVLKFETDDEDDGEAAETAADEKARVDAERTKPNRTIHCLDFRAADNAEAFVREIRRIRDEAAVQTHALDMGGLGIGGGSSNGGSDMPATEFLQGSPTTEQLAKLDSPSDRNVDAQPTVIEEPAGRRWYPVIDFSRCTNCMECIDFCLFGVYGVDTVDTILVEQPDNCRKGCPACSRVCPENAIIFPQHKSPAIAGSPDVEAGGLKVDLSKLFGAPDESPEAAAVRERDEQLMLAGRDKVGAGVGLKKRQADKSDQPKDELDNLMDQLDELDI